MVDQASELRKLALQSALEAAAAGAAAPRLLVLSGGKGGVGVTTIAVNLSVALALRRVRVVLVDANLYRADVAALCGVTERGSVADVLAARRALPEVLVPGPAGIQLAPGLWAPNTPADYTVPAQERLLRQLAALGSRADLVVLDAGNGASDVVRRFWHAADDILLVTTPETLSVMDAYATLKRLAGPGGPQPLRLLVNQVPTAQAAEDVYRRIETSCQRFLGFGLRFGGELPPDAALRAASGTGRPAVLDTPHSPAAAALDRLAVSLIAEAAQRRRNAAGVQPPLGQGQEMGRNTELLQTCPPITGHSVACPCMSSWGG